mmetsp:Transcript_22441/g.36200  ORF Transcript_22441/g.36200 Transcript_22441/m.36200 type:complete len:224 (-) Transcript_22441:779-1450(-)
MPSIDVLRSGTGMDGSKSSPSRLLCIPTNAVVAKWNTPPVMAPSAESSAALATKEAPRIPMLYWRKGPHLSKALLGIASIARCQPNLCATPNERDGVRHHTVIALASESCSTFAAARSHSALRLSPRCAASYITAPPIVTVCSNAIFHRKAGSAMSRPTNARDAQGVQRDTARTMEGRTSTDMNRTSCEEETMPISIAMRMAAGTSPSVLNHSSSTALTALRS